MKATKIFMMAALALMTIACSNDDFTEQPIEQPVDNNNKEITITATLAPKGNDGMRAVVDNGDDKITVTWAVDEHLAILYTKDGNQMADARITAVDDVTGAATITFTVEGGTPDNTDCQIVYPLSAAKSDKSGVKAYADMLATQDGVLDGDLDVRVGAGKIQVTTPSLDVTTQPAAQYSIFKFTIQNLSSTDKTATQFKVSDNSGNVITTVTPSSATGTLYVALPVLATGMYWFNATIDSKPYIAKATVSTATVAGKYYQSTVKMATVGNAILSDGKFATKGTSGQQAVIVYVGTVDKYFNHFLAIALADAAYGVTWSAALTAIGTYAGNHPITIGGTTYNNTNACISGYYDVVSDNNATTSATATTLHQGWRMPTVTDWRYLYAGIFGKSPTDPIGVNHGLEYSNSSSSGDDKTKIRQVVSNKILKSYAVPGATIYNTWFSSEVTGNDGKAWDFEPDYCSFYYVEKTNTLNVVAVFAY